VIIVTGAGDPDGAQPAITSGAWDYIEKGISSKHIALALKRALDYRRHHQPTDAPPAMVSLLRRNAIIDNNPQINACLDMVAHCAASDVNVLITGETGTGKELFARAIHANSARAPSPRPKRINKGSLMQADQGTSLLDEVGELSPAFQKAFLRVLEERRVRPLAAGRRLPAISGWRRPPTAK